MSPQKGVGLAGDNERPKNISLRGGKKNQKKNKVFILLVLVAILCR
jgi:hypothetical protein